jgi:hypothetical protein
MSMNTTTAEVTSPRASVTGAALATTTRSSFEARRMMNWRLLVSP